MQKKLNVTILLDRSGSMESCRNATIDAVNEYVGGLKAETEVEARLSLVLFDGHNDHEVVFDAMPAAEVPALTRDTFVPRANTPLRDAIGKVVHRIDHAVLLSGENVALVIVTDGHENASKEFTAEACKALLDGRQKDKNWLVIYLGANQDAIVVGGYVGTQASNTMSFDTANVGEVMRSASRATKAYGMTGSAAEAAFTEEERRKAKEPTA